MNTFAIPTRALKAAAKMAANDPVRPALNQVYINKNGIYASDSYSAYRYSLDLPALEDRVIAFPAELFKSIKVGKDKSVAIFEEIKDFLWRVDTCGVNPDIYAEEFECTSRPLSNSITRLFDGHESDSHEAIGLGLKYLSKILAAAKIVNESPDLKFSLGANFGERRHGDNSVAILVKSVHFDPNSTERAEFLIMPVRL